ncbi:hypothetical protein [Streptomyces sp. NPDC093097]|uniref:hypothetical protein n=1 Tax=Streptomyces sp. NPDC093097 TaxID=3366027 RepID=UPI003824F412
MTATETWPEGVIIRFLTVAGEALRDPNLTVDMSLADHTRFATAACNGCGTTHTPVDYEAYYLDCEYSPEAAAERALASARVDAAKWAQAHAEKCRAIPRPSV